MAEPVEPGALPVPLPALVYQLEGEPRVFPIPEGATTLGSARDNDLVLEHESVHPHQVVIMRAGDDVELRDLFAGETRVNGAERRSGPLHPGDVLSLGDVRLRLLRVELPAELDEDSRPSTTTGRFERFERGEVDEQQLERELFAAKDAAPAAVAAATPVGSGTARFETKKSLASDEKSLASGEKSLGRGGSGSHARPPEPGHDTRRVLREKEARRARALARSRQLSDELRSEPDFERLLEKLALAFLDLFNAHRAVAVLFEEDGKNPLLTVERCRDGSHQGAGIAPEIVERCLQARTVVRVAGGPHSLVDGLAAPLIPDSKPEAAVPALGLLYFERNESGADPLELEDVHLMAILANQAALVIAPLLSAS